MNKQEKKKVYNERVLQIEHGTFTPFFFQLIEKYWEELPYVLFKIIRFIIKET